MKQSVLIAVVVVVVIIVGAGAYYAVSSSKAASSTSTSAPTTTASSSGIVITGDNVTLNTDTGIGTWKLSLENTGDLTVSSIQAYLLTPTNAYICSGATASAGLLYKNCPVGTGSALPPNTSISGSSTGAGPESATPGVVYPVDIHLAFTSGTVSWLNSTVTVAGTTG